MGENQERRQANRQKRGVLRVEEIIQTAGALFAETGYDNTTTAMIAARVGISAGSFYQFFPNKEAITLKFAKQAVQELSKVYDEILVPEIISLPLEAYLGRFIDGLVVCNLQYPGYFALSLASTISPALAKVLADLQATIFGKLDQILAVRWPESTPPQRRLPLLIMQRLFVAMLPFILDKDEEKQQAVIAELKLVAYRYLEPMVNSHK